MDSGLILKPVATTPPIGDGRSGSAVRNAVAPDLALSQAVTAAADTASAPYAGPSRLPDAVLDPQSRDALYRAADVRARRAARQTREKAMLRERAYTHAAREGDGDESTVEVTV